MALENVNILKLSATALAGLFTGGAVFVNIVEIPALRNVTDTEAARKNWKESFLLASRWQAGLGMATVVSGAAVYLLDESDNRNLWIIGSGVMASIFPWTMIVMMPDIKRLLKDNVVREQGGDWVRTKIEAWNKQHMFRSLVGVSVFGMFLYAINKV